MAQPIKPERYSDDISLAAEIGSQAREAKYTELLAENGEILILKEEVQTYEFGRAEAENSEDLFNEDSTGCEWVTLSLHMEEQEWVVVVDNKDFVAIGSQFDGDGLS